MRESVTYQAIVDEGVEKGQVTEVRKLIKQLGRKLLGPPSKKTLSTLANITNLDRLEAMHVRLAEVKSWRELLSE